MNKKCNKDIEKKNGWPFGHLPPWYYIAAHNMYVQSHFIPLFFEIISKQ